MSRKKPNGIGTTAYLRKTDAKGTAHIASTGLGTVLNPVRMLSSTPLACTPAIDGGLG